MEDKDLEQEKIENAENVEVEQPVEEEVVAEVAVEAQSSDDTVETEVPVDEAELKVDEATEEIVEETANVVEKQPEKPKKQKVKKEKVKKVKVKKEKVKKEKLEPVDEFAGLTDDEIYTKLQTEKLVKRKKNKRIATFVGLCFSLALAVCVIVLAVVPVSMKPGCVNGGFSTVKLHNGRYNPESVSYHEGEAGYSQFMDYYNKSFEQSYLEALFNGSFTTVKYEESIEKGMTAADILGTSGELNSNGVVYLEFNFDEEQELKYTSGRKNRYWDGQFTYKKAYVVVNTEEGMRATNVYVVVDYPTFDKNGEQTGVVNKGPYVITITVKANTNVVYEAWKNGEIFK